jgi:predicted DCC family thiol-disulfide oxidoreductase YuxK
MPQSTVATATRPRPKTVPVVRFVVKGDDTDQPCIPGGRPYTVVYDGTCTICGKLVKMLRKWDRDGMLEILPSQNSCVRSRFPWIPDRAYLESVQLIGPGGRTWQGAAAIEHIIDLMPKGKLLTWVFSIPFVRPLAEKFYRWFARNRYKMGCGTHCQLRAADLDFAEKGELTTK